MNTTKLTVKDSALTFLVGFLLCQIGVVTITCVTMVIFKLSNLNTGEFSSFLNTAIGYTITSLAMYLVMLGVFFFFNKNKENKITHKAKPKKLLFYITIAILSFLTLYPIIICCDSLIVKLGAKINILPYALSTKNYFLSIISLVIAPAICEELLFRGLIFKGLKKHGKILSITLSALMFCIYHMAISQTIYPLLMGLLLGVIMYYEDNIYYCIAVHMTNNFLSLTLSYFNINLVFNHWSYILLAIVLCVVFVSIVLTLTIKHNQKSPKIKMAKHEKIYLFTSLTIMILFWILVNFA